MDVKKNYIVDSGHEYSSFCVMNPTEPGRLFTERGSGSGFTNCYEIWQQRYLDAWQISERYDHYNI